MSSFHFDQVFFNNKRFQADSMYGNFHPNGQFLKVLRSRMAWHSVTSNGDGTVYVTLQYE